MQSLTLIAVIMYGLDLLGLDLILHGLHKIAWIVRFDDLLLSSRDHLTYSLTKEDKTKRRKVRINI